MQIIYRVIDSVVYCKKNGWSFYKEQPFDQIGVVA
jgi:hypothetical protein